MLKRENQRQIERFLNGHDDAAIADPAVEWGLAGLFGRQILPGEARMDGFFYAVLRKSS